MRVICGPPCKGRFFLIETATAFTVDVSLYHGDGFWVHCSDQTAETPYPKRIWVLGMTAPKTNMEPKNDGFS